MIRRVRIYTKYETAELNRMFVDVYFVYKIFKNLNLSQNSIRNNLIKFSLIEGEITPEIQNTNLLEILLNYKILSFLFNIINILIDKVIKYFNIRRFRIC